MNSLIEWLNMWGGRLMDFALPMLWQSSLLIAAVFVFDFLLRRKLRASVRYALWFVVFLKLLLPPTLALPTGAAWWLRGRPATVAVPQVRSITVNYSEPVIPFVPPAMPMVHVEPPAPTLSRDAWFLVVVAAVNVLLAAWVALRWRVITRCVGQTKVADANVSAMLDHARQLAGVRRTVRLRVTAQAMSPAVCGLFRPVILLPQSLIEKLTENQLRAVLLHELIHLQRRDVWVNCAQTLLQIVYWWHPLLWVANARVRRVREEAVDDAVMCALSDEAEVYAPTLLEVAKLAFSRPLASLGLVGILESRNALRHRIERLLSSTTPRRAGVSMVSVICLAAFTALAVPMGEPPARSLQSANISDGSDIASEKLIPYKAKVNSEVFTRNLKARAEGTMHTTNDDLNQILAAVVDGFGVDCRGERAVTFNAATGEVTAQNTSEALGVLDEVVRELNLKGGEYVLNPPHGLKQVLIEAQFYLIRPDDFQKLGLDSGRMHREDQMSPWWDLSSDQLRDIQQHIRNLGIENLSSPRIQTSHGISANLIIGDGTNNIALDCMPLVHDDLINLTTLARTTGKYAPNGKGWPDFAGHTNCAIFSRLGIPDGAGVLFRADNVGATTDNELIVLLRARTVGSSANNKTPSLGDLPAAGRLAQTESNGISSATHLSEATVSQLVQDGKVLFQLGKMDEAEAKLNQALAKDPNSQAALYYLSLIKQTKVRGLEDSQGAPRARNVPGPGGQPNLYARTNTIYTSATRQKIYDKLNKITFDKVSYPDMPLSEVMRNLAELTNRRDPDPQGLNFVLNKARPKMISDNGMPIYFDPTTGDAAASDTNLDIDLAAVKVNLNQSLTNARLIDVLEAITKSADHPITYSILDYGIEFSLKPPGTWQQLYTRTFKVDPNTFVHGLQNIGVMGLGAASTNGANVATAPSGSSSVTFDPADTGTQGTIRRVPGIDPTSQTQLAVINFFNAIGVNLAAPKSVFFNARVGTLTVRATDNDLELIEQAISTLNSAPSEVPEKAASPALQTRTFKLDVNTFFLALQKRGVIPAITNAIVSTPKTPSGQRMIQAVVPDSAGAAFVTNVLNGLLTYFRNNGVDLAPKSLFYNDRQATLTVRATEKDLNTVEQLVSVLNSAETAVTVKGRFVEVDKQFFKMLSTNGIAAPTNGAQNRILTEEQFKPILKALQKRGHADLLNEGEVTTLSGRQANFQVVDVQTIVFAATNKTPPFDTETVPFGTTLDVTAWVAADGHTVQLKAIPSVTEFLGYEDVKSGKLLKTFKYPETAFPKSRIRQTTTDTVVSDGDTLMLGDLGDEWVITKPDGTSERKPVDNKSDKQLVVFVTPAIVDRAGNRVNADGPTVAR